MTNRRFPELGQSRLGQSRRFLGMALLAACALQATEIRVRGIDPDEFEHLHAAGMVSRGAVPYRDFFEHHAPALYYLLQPLFGIAGRELSVLWLARLLSWFFSLGTLALTAGIAGRLGGGSARWIGGTLLAWTTVFHLKGIEVRPDVPATFFIAACFALGLGTPWTLRRGLTIGLLGGVATLFTQKSIVPIAGLTLAATLCEWRLAGAARALRVPLAVGVGGFVAWGTALALFASAGAQKDFIHGAIEQLIAWPVRSRRWDQLRPTLVAEPILWIAGLVEICSQLKRFRDAEARRDPRLLVAIATAFSLVSLVWVKATYAQFYLLWFPMLAVLAACRIGAWCLKLECTRGGFVLPLAGGFLVALQLALSWRALELASHGALPNLWATLRQVISRPALIPVALLLGFGVALVWFARRRNGPAVLGIVLCLGMFHAALRVFDAALWSNAEQVRRIGRLEQHVGPDETVLDGYSGYAALRPHAWHYWWINEYSLALMSPADRGENLLATLEANPPAAVLFDRDLERLPPLVTDWIRAHYVPAENEPWLWLPKPPETSGDR